MQTKSSKLLRNHRGASTVEYALLASALSLAMCVITPGLDGNITNTFYGLPFVNGAADEGRLTGNGDGFGTIRMPPPGSGGDVFGSDRLNEHGGTRGTQPGGGIIIGPNRPDGDSNSGNGDGNGTDSAAGEGKKRISPNR